MDSSGGPSTEPPQPTKPPAEQAKDGAECWSVVCADQSSMADSGDSSGAPTPAVQSHPIVEGPPLPGKPKPPPGDGRWVPNPFKYAQKDVSAAVAKEPLIVRPFAWAANSSILIPKLINDIPNIPPLFYRAVFYDDPEAGADLFEMQVEAIGMGLGAAEEAAQARRLASLSAPFGNSSRPIRDLSGPWRALETEGGGLSIQSVNDVSALEIAEAAHRWNADLIITGAHGPQLAGGPTISFATQNGVATGEMVDLVKTALVRTMGAERAAGVRVVDIMGMTKPQVQALANGSGSTVFGYCTSYETLGRAGTFGRAGAEATYEATSPFAGGAPIPPPPVVKLSF
jgi:hypothetical protein